MINAKIIHVALIAIFLVSCTVAPREHKPPYEWKTIEGLYARQRCFDRCPTPNSCHMSWLGSCVEFAQRIDEMKAKKAGD